MHVGREEMQTKMGCITEGLKQAKEKISLKRTMRDLDRSKNKIVSLQKVKNNSKTFSVSFTNII